MERKLRRYARGQSWYTETEKPHGGYCIVHAERLMDVWSMLQEGELQLRDVRVWLACHEMNARRCQLDRQRTPSFGLDELERLVGGTGGQHLRASLRRLERVRAVCFDEAAVDTSPGSAPRGRLIPVPRPLLRMLAKARGRAFIATTLGHLLRCLYYKRGTCRSGGWCRASWVAETFGVGLRSVKEARASLVTLGVLETVDADQLRLNRLGLPVIINMAWHPESARRPRQSTTVSAPPREHKELSLQRVDHQKPARAAGPAGARKRGTEPDLNNIRTADLEDPWRLAALFKQARMGGLVKRTEADVLAFFTAAAHAIRVGINGGAIFHWQVTNRAWAMASHKDEDMARRQLRALGSHDENTQGPS